jgi:lysophospholipase L1-like esterase
VFIALASIGAYVYFNLFLTPDIGQAGPQVPAEPFKKVWNSQTVLLLGVGDSITQGFGASEGYSYFDRLIKSPAADSCEMFGKNLSSVFPKFMSRNIAVAKTDSMQHLQIIKKIPIQPQNVFGVIVITTGGNDLIHNYGKSQPKECAMYGASFGTAEPWINNFKNRLDEIIFELTAKFPGGCEIFIANIYDPSDGTGNTNKKFTGLPEWPDGLAILAEYNKVISDCADRYSIVHLVDIHTPFLGHGITCRKPWLKNYHSDDPHFWYAGIIEDPNPRGHDAIRRAFLLEMIKTFSNK